MTNDNRPFMPQRGNYRNLIVYQKAECIYDITYYFAHKFLEKGDRTIDQMIQAARSCKQNIAEGSAASTTSKETELKLTNVARASMQELLPTMRTTYVCATSLYGTSTAIRQQRQGRYVQGTTTAHITATP